MRDACEYAKGMARMIQVRNVPEQHRLLKSRAALAGQSLSDFLLAELRRSAQRPTREEVGARLARRSRVAPIMPPAQAVREEREAR